MLAASLVLVSGNTSFQSSPDGKNRVSADSAQFVHERLAIEKQIAKSLGKNPEADGTYLLSHKFIDLNGDGTMEVITYDTEISGNGWGMFYVFLTKPLRLVLTMEGAVNYEILKSSSKGFRDLKALFRPASRTYRWDGKQYIQSGSAEPYGR